jgi:hypothetical protein
LTSYRISGLTDEQRDDLVARAEDFLEECWKRKPDAEGPRMRDAAIVTCGYIRNKITEEAGRGIRRQPVMHLRYIPTADEVPRPSRVRSPW